MTEREKELARKARNEYQKEWRAKNPDKVKASNERYWLRLAEKAKAEQDKEVI